MKRLIVDFSSLSFIILLVLFQSSCENSDAMYHQDFSSEINASEVSQKKPEKSKGCNVDFNAMDINISWADDCSTARIFFALCCECTFSSSFSSGCTIPSGVLEILTEECSFDFYIYEVNVPNISIRENTCIPLVFEIENKGCDNAFIRELWFNGENLAVDPEYSDIYCP